MYTQPYSHPPCAIQPIFFKIISKYIIRLPKLKCKSPRHLRRCFASDLPPQEGRGEFTHHRQYCENARSTRSTQEKITSLQGCAYALRSPTTATMLDPQIMCVKKNTTLQTPVKVFVSERRHFVNTVANPGFNLLLKYAWYSRIIISITAYGVWASLIEFSPLHIKFPEIYPPATVY